METQYFYRVKATKANEIKIEKYQVLSGNAKGVKILTDKGITKFVKYNIDRKKRFAYASQKEALQEFLLQKRKVVKNLLENYTKTLALIESAKKCIT